MSLTGALNIGRTALAATQAAIQVTGNNISNAGNADYTRQSIDLSPNRDQQIQNGIFVGTGVNVDAINRNIDESLQGRIRSSVSENEGAGVTQQWLGRVESVFNELSEQDLSTRFSKFFAAWSNLANEPQDVGLRQVVLQEGRTLADSFKNLDTQLDGLQGDIDNRLTALAKNANDLAEKVAGLNQEITTTEGGGTGEANGLRDQRDAVLKQLATLVDIKTVPQENGAINVYVGSEPLVLESDNRGVALRQDKVDGQIVSTVVFKANDGEIKLAAGQIGALTQVRDKVGQVNTDINDLASGLIFELNKVHTAGQGLEGFTSVTASNQVTDPTVALNNKASGLKQVATTGSFVVHVKNTTTGLVTSQLVQVDLDGLNGNDTTLNSLASSLTFGDVSATIVGGKLKVASNGGPVEISFSQDSSGVLASLGVNSFFNGSDASNITVNQSLLDNPKLLAASQNGEPADNHTALAIAALETTSLGSLSGSTLKDTYEATINDVAASANGAKNTADATLVVRQTLEGQREAISGVSLDEEAINLVRQQRAYQGAARLISTVNELMDELMGLVK